MIKIALVGNPNSGKTSLFNQLSIQKGRVGNYAGVTVEMATSPLKRKYAASDDVLLIDLPGMYGMDAFSQDEHVAHDVLKHHDIDLIINVIDSTQLERSLSFTLELLSLNIPMIVALNKHDLSHRQGIQINSIQLSQALNSPVIFTEALKGVGVSELIHTALQTHRSDR